MFGLDPLAKFRFLHKNACQRSGHFHREQRVSFWRGGQHELVGTKSRHHTCWRKVIRCYEFATPPRAATVTICLSPSWAQGDRHPLSVLGRCFLPFGRRGWVISLWPCLTLWERKRGLEREIEQGWETMRRKGEDGCQSSWWEKLYWESHNQNMCSGIDF